MTKPCVKCGSINRGKNGACKDCAKEYRKATSAHRKQYADEYNKKYEALNRDRLIEQKRNRYANNREELQAKARQYYAENRESRIAYSHEHAIKNKESVLATQLKYRQQNYEKRREYSKEYSKNNKEKMMNYNIKRARVVKEGTISEGLFTLLLQEQDMKCPGCLSELLGVVHMDHYLPLKLGGRHEDSNIQLLCAPCNLKKNAKYPERWLKEILNSCDLV